MAIEVVIPVLGINASSAIISRWLKQEGEDVAKGELILEVETEKVTTEVESPGSGILAKILHGEGESLPAGTVIGLILQEGEDLPPDLAAASSGATEPAAEESSAPVAQAQDEPAGSTSAGGKTAAVPAARHLAKEKGLDISRVTGTGPGGVILSKDVASASQAPAGSPAAERPSPSPVARRLAEAEGVDTAQVAGSGARGRVMKADVLAHMQKGGEAPAKSGQVIPMSNIRQVIARRLSESYNTAPHIYLFTEIFMNELLAFRKKILPEMEKTYGVRPSVNDLLIKAVALNLYEDRIFNSQLVGNEIHIQPAINVGLAVAGPEGLIVPSITDADRIGLVEVAKQRADLVERAREGKLSLEEIERGTFTISSLAQYDITHFTAIINPPQAAILSVAATMPKLVMQDGQVVEKKAATFGLSSDHRIIDGAVAADFLSRLKRKLENPWVTFLHL